MNNKFLAKMDYLKTTAAKVSSLRKVSEGDQTGYGPTTQIAHTDGWFFTEEDSGGTYFWNEKDGDLSLACLEHRIEETREILLDCLDSPHI